MKPLKGTLTTPNKNANQNKKGAYYHGEQDKQ